MEAAVVCAAALAGTIFTALVGDLLLLPSIRAGPLGTFLREAAHHESSGSSSIGEAKQAIVAAQRPADDGFRVGEDVSGTALFFRDFRGESVVSPVSDPMGRSASSLSCRLLAIGHPENRGALPR